MKIDHVLLQGAYIRKPQVPAPHLSPGPDDQPALSRSATARPFSGRICFTVHSGRTMTGCTRLRQTARAFTFANLQSN